MVTTKGCTASMRHKHVKCANFVLDDVYIKV